MSSFPESRQPHRGEGANAPADDRDPILDPLLAETLGGETVPDLCDRILQQLVARSLSGETFPEDYVVAARAEESASAGSLLPPVAQPAPASLPGLPLSARGHRSAYRPRRRNWHAVISLSVAACAALLLVGYLISDGLNQSGNLNQADNANQAGSQVPAENNGDESNGQLADNSQNPTNEGGTQDSPGVDPAEEPTPENSTPSEIVDADPPANSGRDDAEESHEPPPVVAQDGPASSDAESSEPVPVSTSSDAEIIAAINDHIRRRWQEEGVQPAELADEGEWCRRVYLDLIGRIPTYEETLALTSDNSTDKRRNLVLRLLNSDVYLEEYARNWTNVYTALLIGRADEPQSPVNREGMRQYLRRSFLENKPYDQMSLELLASSGSNTPGEENFNGAVNFLLDNLDQNATAATAKTASIFLGLQVQCTQCHDHPFNDWKQQQFWELNSFFRQTLAKRERGMRNDPAAELVDVTFKGESGDPNEADVFYERQNGLLRVAYPVFLDGQKIDPSGWIGEVDRRAKLAEFVVKSNYFRRAVVNRVWAHFLGYGFTNQVDDMGPHVTASHPELLNYLAVQFAGHGYDLRKLMTWLSLSDAYALSSRVPDSTKDSPQAGETPLFSYFYTRQMRPEELYESLMVATELDRGTGSYSQREGDKSRWMQQFCVAYETDENDEAVTFDGSIPQTLEMWNGGLISDATSGEPGTMLFRLAKSQGGELDSPAAKIKRLYLSALSREPSASELKLAQGLWQKHQGDTLAALQDIWWVLLNSNEFILNH